MTPTPRVVPHCSACASSAGAARRAAASAAMPREVNAIARLIAREARAARASAERTRWLTHRPFTVSVTIMPPVNTTPRKAAKSQPATFAPVTEKSTAWLSVSNEIAKEAPTAATSTGWPARVRRSNARLRIPTGRTASPRGARSTARRLASPKSVRKPIEIQVPASSSHSGACHPAASVATATATSVTTTPWPAENSSPDQRARRGLGAALKRARPSIAARWSGSRPCLSPRAKTTARSASQWLGSVSISAIAASLREEKLVPELFPSGSLLENRGGLDEREGKVVEAALHARARGHAPHPFEQALPLRRKDEVGEEQPRVRVRGVSCEPHALPPRRYRP